MSRTKGFLAYLGNVCLQEKFPVWATLLGVAIGGLATVAGTYFIVPNINQALERQKIKSEFIIRNLDDLNSRTRALMSDISELHFSVIRSNQVDPAAAQKISAKIAEMQWKAIELGIIFEGTDALKSVQAYQASLDDVRSAIAKINSKSDLDASQKAAETFSRRTLDVIRELASLAGLKVPSTPPK